MAPSGLRHFLLTSIGIATASCFVPFLYKRIISNTDSVPFVIALPLSVIWIVYLLAGFRLYGWRGLWVLLGLPFALYWPYVIVALIVSCSLGNGCL